MIGNCFRFISAALVIASTLGFSSVEVQASPVFYCKSGIGGDNTAGVIDLINNGCVSGTSRGYAGGGDGVYQEAGGGDSELKVEEAIRQATGRAVDIMLYGKSDSDPSLFTFTGINGGQSGSWDLVNDNILIKYVTFKAANSYVLYELSGKGANSGTFSTLGLLTPNGRNQPGISHITFWTVRPIPSPEPSSIALLGSGLVAAGFIRRRKK